MTRLSGVVLWLGPMSVGRGERMLIVVKSDPFDLVSISQEVLPLIQLFRGACPLSR